MKINFLSRMRNSTEFEHKIAGWIFISPWIIGFFAFSMIPLVKTIILSFQNATDVDQLKNSSFVGFSNYVKAFVFDVDFLPMFGNIVVQTVVSTVMIFVFSLSIAIILNSKIKARGFFRAVYFLPAILGTGLVAQQVMGAVDNSIMNGVPTVLLSYLGTQFSMVIMNFVSAITSIFMRSSVQIVIFLAGLQAISDSLYESAKVDGATFWEMFWKITLPMITPITLVNVIYTIIDSFTEGSNAIMTYIYEMAFRKMQFSYAAALGCMYFVFVLLCVFIVNKMVSRKVFYAN